MLQRTTALTDVPAHAEWDRYCGFLDLSLDGFMRVQEQMLLRYLPQIARSELGRRWMGSERPRTVREFRRSVPLSSYEDYQALLRSGAALVSEDPAFWAQTTRRNSDVTWIPYTEASFDRLMESTIACFLLACATGRGASRLQPGDHVLYNLAPRPYLTGFLADALLT